MYVVGLTAGYFVLRWLAREGYLRLMDSAVGDLVFALALGVVLGGRVGYVLFYDLADTLQHPLDILRIWEGGMFVSPTRSSAARAIRWGRCLGHSPWGRR